LIVPETPTLLLGQNLLFQLKVQLLLPSGEYYSLLLIESQVDSAGRTDGQMEGRARTAILAIGHLKDCSQFPHQK
jgi:hypothetical protein